MKNNKTCLLVFLAICLVSLTSCKGNHVHIWTDDSIVKNSTCIEEGLKRVKCLICEETEEQIIKKTDHNYNTTIVKATCVEDGKETKTCSVCSHTLETTLPKTDHTIVVDAKIDATCTQMGATEGSHCAVCKMIIVEQVKIPMVEHEFENGRCKNCFLIDMEFEIELGTTEGLTYELSATKDYYIVTGIGECTLDDIVISSLYKGLPVKEIGNNAFNNAFSLKSIKMPGSIEIIGDNAFGKCYKLGKVEFSNGLISIGDSAFSGCKELVNIVLPDSLERMGWQVFFNCEKLESIFIPKGVTYVGYDAFKNCAVLTINCEAEKQPRTWSASWNSDNRPVNYNQTK